MNLCLDKCYYGTKFKIIALIYENDGHIQPRDEEKKEDRRLQG